MQEPFRAACETISRSRRRGCPCCAATAMTGRGHFRPIQQAVARMSVAICGLDVERWSPDIASLIRPTLAGSLPPVRPYEPCQVVFFRYAPSELGLHIGNARPDRLLT